MKKKEKYLDYDAIKSAVSVYDVPTEYYGLGDSLKRLRMAEPIQVRAKLA